MIMHFQFASLFILLVTGLLWLIPKKIRSYETRFFGIVLLFATLTILSGIVYSALNMGLIEEISVVTIQFIAKVNNAFLLILIYIIFMYFLSKLIDEKKHKFVIFPFSALPLLESLVLLVVEISVTPLTNISAFGYGSIVLYYMSAFYILLTIGLLFLFRKKLSKWLTFIIIFVTVVLIAGLVLQYFTRIDGLLQLCTVNAVSVMFIALESPLNKIDINYNCFKSTFIIPCLSRYFTNSIEGFAAFIGIQCDFIDASAEENLEKLRKTIIDELHTVPELEVFMSSERDIFVICDSMNLFEGFVEDINEVVMEAKNGLLIANNVKTAIVLTSNIHVAENAESLYRHMSIEKTEVLEGLENHVSCYLDESKIHEVETEEKTRQTIIDALNEDRVETFYQPIYSTKEQRFTSTEALARIRNTDGSVLLPKYFIKVAENSGLIMEIGYKVFEKVCIMLTDPATSELQIDEVDINLSLIQCENLGLADNIIKIAEKYAINPSIINFDITESNFGSVYENLSKNLEKLHEYGFSFSLDDFGTGESNLNYLINFPISSVKIDRHMIWDYFDNAKIRNTIRHLIKLCHKLDLKVSATGIEKISQLDEMARQKIDLIQGYYFFKPMPLDEYLQFLKPNAFEMDETKKKILKSSMQNRTINKLNV